MIVSPQKNDINMKRFGSLSLCVCKTKIEQYFPEKSLKTTIKCNKKFIVFMWAYRGFILK